MKIRIKSKKAFKKALIRFIVLLIAIALTVTGCAVVKKAGGFKAIFKKPGVTHSADLNGVNVPSSVQELLLGFLDSYYKSFLKLETQDISAYFDDGNIASYESYLKNRLAIDFMVNYRISSVNDLKLLDADYKLTFTECKTAEDGSVSVKFSVSDAIVFAFLKDVTSYTSGVQYEALVQTGEKPKIISLKYEGAYGTASDLFDSKKKAGTQYSQAQLTSIAETCLEELKNQTANTLSAYEVQRTGFNNDQAGHALKLTVDNAYDRTAAVEYADQWVGEYKILRNEKWSVYDNYGGNCANFVSQCMFAGGIPMDTEGKEHWKHYSATLNETNAAEGRSTSWTGVDNFYNYCEKNTGYGLRADTDANLYSGQPGDIIEMGPFGKWTHVVIITKVIYDDDGNVIDYLINSNTIDRKSYPLSAYGQCNMRLIRIAGWNNK